MTTNNLNDEQKILQILYLMINALYNANLPIVFKGMLVTRCVLKENNYSFLRLTRDMDGDWIGDEIPLIEMEKCINEALCSLNNISVKAHRDYAEKTSAGFEIYEGDILISSFDLSVKKNKYFKLYDIDGIKFYGQTIEKIIADKMCVVSTRKIFRRIKDLLDIYTLSSVCEIDKDKTIEIIHDCEREIGDFAPFYNQREQIEHAYNTMTWIKDKPDFNIVYDTCAELFKRFL